MRGSMLQDIMEGKLSGIRQFLPRETLTASKSDLAEDHKGVLLDTFAL